MDGGELNRILARFPHLAIGAYEGDRCVGAIMGYMHEKTVWLCNFIVAAQRRGQGIGRRIFECALETIAHEKATQKLFAEDQAVPFYERCGFKADGIAGRFVLGCAPCAAPILTPFDRAPLSRDYGLPLRYSAAAFGEDRALFLCKDMIYPDSQLLVSENGVLHMRTIGGYVFVGVFLASAYANAELLLRTAIGVRSKLPIMIVTPIENHDAVSLLKRYGFEQQGATICMSRGEKVRENCAMIYGYATAASHA